MTEQTRDTTGDDRRNDGRTVDAIRDLIFGQQMRDYESRFAQLEQALQERLAQLGQNVDSDIKQLEQAVQSVRDEFATRLNDEVETLQARQVSRAQLAESLRRLADQFDPV
ncbi:MAG: hypothetical protein ABF296_01050 [Oceanococcaceae bacterium]